MPAPTAGRRYRPAPTAGRRYRPALEAGAYRRPALQAGAYRRPALQAGAYRRPALQAGAYRRAPFRCRSAFSVSFLSDPGLKHAESPEARRKAGTWSLLVWKYAGDRA